MLCANQGQAVSGRVRPCQAVSGRGVHGLSCVLTFEMRRLPPGVLVVWGGEGVLCGNQACRMVCQAVVLNLGRSAACD
jgi:hypothetical protein